jgi:hypothetical protein
MKECLARFHESEQATKLREATKTPKRPGGVVVGKGLLKKFLCACVRVRGASECDDYLATAATINLPKWNKARKSWHREAETKGVVCNCRMHTQARTQQPELLDTYLSMSKGIMEMERALLPCGMMAWPAYQLPEGRPFQSYFGACASGKCPKKHLARNNPFDMRRPASQACGWDMVFGDDCPIECTEDPFEWQEWKQQQRGSDHDGQPTYAPELVPVRGTRREFLAYQRSAIAAAMPHRSAVITPSSHRHHAVITPSSRRHHAVITPSSHRHHAVITPPSVVITPSSHRHHAVITPSSRRHCGFSCAQVALQDAAARA